MGAVCTPAAAVGCLAGFKVNVRGAADLHLTWVLQPSLEGVSTCPETQASCACLPWI